MPESMSIYARLCFRDAIDTYYFADGTPAISHEDYLISGMALSLKIDELDANFSSNTVFYILTIVS